MKISFISNYSELYGANRSLLTLIEYFHLKGDQVIVILPSKGSMVQSLHEKGIPYKIIPYYSQPFYYKFSLKYLATPFLWILDLLIFPYICLFIKKWNPDIIYSNTSAENLGILVAKVLQKKHISHIREFMQQDYQAYFFFGNKIKRAYISQSDGIVYVSQSVANYVNLGDILPKNHEVIYNGVSSPKVDFLEKDLPQTINFGIVGILDPAKGQDIAIKYFRNALQEYPNSLLHIFGDKEGAYKKELLMMVNKYNLSSKVIFHGFENDQERIYNQIDILLMCSLSEGFGRVTVEAMQRGIPVLGYNSAGTTELIENAKDGFLFDTEEQFLSTLKELLSSKERFNAIRKQALLQANLKFSIDVYCSKVDAFLDKVMEN